MVHEWYEYYWDVDNDSSVVYFYHDVYDGFPYIWVIFSGNTNKAYSYDSWYGDIPAYMIEDMIDLAIKNEGLNEYINENVYDRYSNTQDSDAEPF